MATIYSDQLTRSRAGRLNPANQQAGKVRIQMWDFATIPAGNIADVYVLFKLEKDERVILGREFHTALSSGGATATGSIGTYFVGADGLTLGAVDSAARFLAAITMDAAGQNFFGDLQALLPGIRGGAGCVLYDNPPVDTFVVIVNSVEAFAAAGRLTGWALITKD